MLTLKLSFSSLLLIFFSSYTLAIEKVNAMKVSGEFQVKLQPLDLSAKAIDGVNFGRMSIDKTFSGALEATTKGSAGYVAIEQVSGSLSGKKGSFVLQHFGTVNHGKDNLVLEVVPDSGSGELSGISGKMSIKIENGKHIYAFEYDLVTNKN
jgi:hypothetical protein